MSTYPDTAMGCTICGHRYDPHTHAHYPTTAELAAFRERISWHSRAPHEIAARVGMIAPVDGGAWPDERQHGIGWRLAAAPYADTIWPHRALLARQDASALRSRAYAAGWSAYAREILAAVDPFARAPGDDGMWPEIL